MDERQWLTGVLDEDLYRYIKLMVREGKVRRKTVELDEPPRNWEEVPPGGWEKTELHKKVRKMLRPDKSNLAQIRAVYGACPVSGEMWGRAESYDSFLQRCKRVGA